VNSFSFRLRMALPMETITLANGKKMPAIGFGCAFGNWTISDAEFSGFEPEKGWSAMNQALDAGLRHFDTAYVYRSQPILGTLLGQRFCAAEPIARSDLWITTKIFHHYAHPAFTFPGTCYEADDPELEGKLKKMMLGHLQESLRELQLGWVDLVLLHWPSAPNSTDSGKNRLRRHLAWQALEEAYSLGLARSIGVSNFTEKHLQDLEEDGLEVVPMVNQIEVSPHAQYRAILDYCKEKNIVIQAYSPLGSDAGKVLKAPLLVQLAEKYKKDVGQLILRWLYQQGICVLPRSSSAKRLRSNCDIFDFTIEQEDMDAIKALGKEEPAANENPYSCP